MTILDSIARVLLVFLLWPLIFLGPIIAALLAALCIGGCGTSVQPVPAVMKPVVLYLTDLEHDEQMDTILRTMPTTDDMTIVIDSIGGWTYLGDSFGRAAAYFQGRGGKLTCVVDGVGYSTAFTVWTHCDHRKATKRSLLLWHEPGYESATKQRYTIHYFNIVGKAQKAFPWSDREYTANIDYLRAKTVELLEYYRAMLPMHPETVRHAYEQNRQWSAIELEQQAPTYFELID